MSDVLRDLLAAMENPTTAVVEEPGYFYAIPRAVVDHARNRLAATPPAADPLDVERLAEDLHAAGIGCSSDICEPTTSTYIGLRKTMHETDARDLIAARLSREGEQR